MSKRTHIQKISDSMQPRYDFGKGKRTDHARRYQKGHEVRIERANGSTTTQHFTLEDGAILLDPDVRAVFKSSNAVNQALRCLIPLVRSTHAKAVG